MPAKTEPKAAKHAVNLRMDAKVIFSLKVHSLDTGQSISDIVERLVRNHVPRYEVSEFSDSGNKVIRTK